MRDSTPWLADVTLDYAVKKGGLRLHPDALKYYREAGVAIHEESM